MRNTFVVVATAVMLSSCSSIGNKAHDFEAGEYVGWYCEGDINSDKEWNCRQDVLVNGQPVAKKEAAEQLAEVESLPVVEPDPLEVESTTGPEPEQADLAETDPGTGAPKVDHALAYAEESADSSLLLEQEEGLEREDLESRGLESRDLENNSEPKAAPSELAATAEDFPVEVTEFDMAARGYTLQLGAYIRSSFAEKTAREYGLDSTKIWIGDVVTSDRPLVVLVYGHYPSIETALTGGEQLQEHVPELQFWVRSMRSLRKAKAAAE